MRRRVLNAVLGLALGYLLGVAAWGPGRAPVLALLLPAGIALCSTRLQAFAFAAGYTGGVLRFAVTFIGSWFNDNLWVGGSAVLTYMLVAGAVWCLGWSRAARPAVRGARMAIAWLLALGPAAIAIPGHPLVASGFILPGTGWVGVVLALVMAAACAAWLPPFQDRLSRAAQWAIGAWTCLALAGAGHLLANAQAAPSTRLGVYAVSTSWGKVSSIEQGVDRITAIGGARIPDEATVVLWPESVVGRWDPSMFQVMNMEVLRRAAPLGRTVVVGMDIAVKAHKYFNAAVAFYPDGTSQTAVARQPAPLSLWRPWAAETFLADWGASNVLQFGEERAALIFCYEEYMPILYLINEARDRPTVYVAVANTWAARQRQASAVQTWHSLGMARLFGRPYFKAENQPVGTPGGMPLPSILPDRRTPVPTPLAQVP